MNQENTQPTGSNPKSLWIIIVLALICVSCASYVAVSLALRIRTTGQESSFDLGYRQGCLDTYQGKSLIEIRENGDGNLSVWKKTEVVSGGKVELPLPTKNDLLPELALSDPVKTPSKKK